MPEGGRLLIATSSASFPSNKTEKNHDEAFVVLEVTDTGFGMTVEVQARIFEPFFTTKEMGRGTGLGLSTVLGIVQRSGGSIEVKSTSGRGSAFRILLPQVAEPLSVTSPVSSLAETDPRGMGETILLAEDESGIRAMTRAYLESMGYRVLEAADGLEAIARSFEYAGPIDLVVSDLLMPRRRGDSAVKEIRTQRPGVKVIFISGYADDSTVATPEEILYKPFTFPELGRRVRAVLDASPQVPNSSMDSAAD